MRLTEFLSLFILFAFRLHQIFLLVNHTFYFLAIDFCFSSFYTIFSNTAFFSLTVFFRSPADAPRTPFMRRKGEV